MAAATITTKKNHFFEIVSTIADIVRTGSSVKVREQNDIILYMTILIQPGFQKPYLCRYLSW